MREKKKKPYVKDKWIELVYSLFKKEQKRHPFKAVTKKQVYAKVPLNEKNKKIISYRIMERAIDRLCPTKVTKEKDTRGKFWLPDNYNKNMRLLRKSNEEATKYIESLKHEQKKLSKEKDYFRGGYRIGKPYIDALQYCDSEEDWELLQAWFTKMNQNKYEQEQVEAWDNYQEEIAEIEEQIKKEKK